MASALTSISLSQSLTRSLAPSARKTRKDSYQFKSPVVAARRRMYDDPFDYGVDPDIEFGEIMSSGKQNATVPRPASDSTSASGYLTFPAGYNLEIASLGLYIRGDVRSAAFVGSGGVYENLLLFPVIQLLKDRFPGVELDVLAGDRGKQVYELNKNVRRAWVYDVDDVLVNPADFTDTLGKLKNNCYDLVLSTRLAGLGHAMFLFLTDARQRIGYVHPNANGAGASAFLSKSIRPSTSNLAELGFYMYKDLTDFLSQPLSPHKTPEAPIPVPPLKIGISKRVREAARATVASATGLEPGQYVVLHGLESISAASMRSKGDPDSHIPVEVVARLAGAIKEPLLVVIPNENDRSKVEALLGSSAKIVQITTPGKLAAVIDDSIGLVASNTAAIQIANALLKPSVGLFGSPDTAARFVPNPKEKNCVIVSSKTGKLAGVDVKSIVLGLSTFATEV